jgi:hypothetical protein
LDLPQKNHLKTLGIEKLPQVERTLATLFSNRVHQLVLVK